MMVDKVEAPDPTTVVFRLKFATSAFLPALADPFAWIYKKANLDKDPHWYEKNILGSGPFKFVAYEIGQSIKGVRNPDYYHQGTALSRRLHRDLCRQAGDPGRCDPRRPRRDRVPRLSALGARRARKALGDKITVQESDWNCGSVVEPNHKKKPFDDARVRRALTLAIDRWHGAPELSKIANVHTVGGIVFPGSPLAADQGGAAADRRVLARHREVAGRGEAAVEGGGAEGLSFELLNRNVDQPYKYDGTWVIDEWSKIGLHVDAAASLPTGPWFEAMRTGNFDVVLAGNCQSVVNPLLDVQRYLPTRSTRRITAIRGPAGDRALRQDAARDRLREAAQR